MKKPGFSNPKGNFDAIIVLGAVDDNGSYLPGWDYPFSKAEEEAVKNLKGRGFKRIGVFREPDLNHLRKLLSGKGLRGVYFLGHGEFIKNVYSFLLNSKENLSATELRKWAKEDLVVPGMSTAAIQRFSGNSHKDNALSLCSGYNFELAVLHSCHSLRDPEFRSALAWGVDGNPWYSFASLPPICSYTYHLLRVDSEAFSIDPQSALENSVTQAIRSLNEPGTAFIQPGYRKALRLLLSDIIAARTGGKVVLNKIITALRKQFRIEFYQGKGTIIKYSLDELKGILQTDGLEIAEKAIECDVPTKTSKGLLGCNRTVKGGGPCYQHEEYFELPEDEDNMGGEVTPEPEDKEPEDDNEGENEDQNEAENEGQDEAEK